MDTVDPETRSHIMRSIRSVSVVELRARKLAERRARCRLIHLKPGEMEHSPDYANKGRKTVVFVHGCFWHGCPKHFRVPETNSHRWRLKIATNQMRDLNATRQYRAGGWRVIVLWEHELQRKSRRREERRGRPDWKPEQAVAVRGHCPVCGKPFSQIHPGHRDHLVPRWFVIAHCLGDPEWEGNIADCCGRCHSRKAKAENRLIEADIMGFLSGVDQLDFHAQRVRAALRHYGARLPEDKR